MRVLLDLSEQLSARMHEEIETMRSERIVMRAMSVARGRELLAKRDEVLLQIDSWAEAQKDLVKEVFWAMIAEAEIDKKMHETAIGRLSVDGELPAITAGTERAEPRHEAPARVDSRLPAGTERPEPKHETTARHLWVDGSRAAGAERPEPNGITPLGIRRSIAVGPLARNGQSFGDSQFR